MQFTHAPSILYNINKCYNIGSGRWGFNHRAPGKYEIASQNLGVKYIVPPYRL